MSGSDIEIDSDTEQQTKIIHNNIDDTHTNGNTTDITATTTTPNNNDTIQPNQTIYINNINDKIKLPEIKKGLYHVFSSCGNIIDIQLHKRIRCRGQAWLIYDNIQSAINAVKQYNNFLFFNKPLHVTYSRNKSDLVAKADKTYQPRPKRKQPNDTVPEGTKQLADTASKKHKLLHNTDQPVIQTEPPHNILFIENLPPTITTEQLTVLFQPYTGFIKCRVIAAKGVAFIDYENELQAGAALNGLQRHPIDDSHLMKITYAKR